MALYENPLYTGRRRTDTNFISSQLSYENVIFLYINLQKSKLYKRVKHVSSETSGNQAYIFYLLSNNSWNSLVFDSVRQLHDTLEII